MKLFQRILVAIFMHKLVHGVTKNEPKRGLIYFHLR